VQTLGGAVLPRVGWQYRHYVRWQRSQLAAGRLRPHRDYWRDRLADLQFSALPLREHGNGSAAGRSGTARAFIGAGVAGGLRRLARAHQTTLFTVMLSAYYALLHRVTGQTDVAIASLFANRARPEIMRTVGFFANLVILRTRFEPGTTFAGLLRRAHATVGEALVHQQVPYYLLSQGELRSGDRRADEVVFQMLPEIPAPVAIGALEVEVLLPEVASRFDLELAVVPRGGGLDVLLQYARGRVDDAWAAGFVAAYASFAAEVAAAPGPGLAG
jgi:non-ribosomal peptide synthetase component F